MSPQRRNPRLGVEDRWHRADKSRSASYGKGKRWRARWVEPSGAEKAKAFDRKTDAEQYLKNVTASMVSGQYVAPEGGNVLTREILHRFLSGLDVKHSTLLGYRSAIDAQIMPRWGDVPLKAIATSDIKGWLVAMQRGNPDARLKRERDGLSSGSARKTGQVFSMALDVAVHDRLIARNPMENVKLPRQGQPRQGMSLTRDQLHGLAEAMTTNDRVLTLVLGYTGLRWGEAIGLTVKSVDYERRRIHVRRTYSEAGGSIREETPKSHEARWVPFPPFLSAELHKVTNGKAQGADIFTTAQGRPIHGTNWIHRVYRPALTRAGIPDAQDRVIHDLRHTYASLAIRAGANVKQLQKAMGHADATITLNQYADLFEDDYADLGERLEPPADSLRTAGPRNNETPGQKTI
ncbi:tyrosine-type recombinase/integrase [Nesterenkonia jeotgali]|uniref:Integrase n=1 Tax=Nesterenkonia jeotgali TaxID=317018 RepID=A0A839FEC1_9MICC|nr:site-specific integrase [Nesterenkonia jeotgali]MBA8920080.1 integrase [Nesterenkonia jeotgali]